MKSLARRAKSVLMNKKGVMGMEVAGGVMKYLLFLGIFAIAMFLAFSTLLASTIFTEGSALKNDTQDVMGNITLGVKTFFAGIPSIFGILLAVVIILAIVLIIYAVRKVTAGSDTGGMQSYQGV